jgi:ATP/maltotriose-dependent transcriptional regulator MalT
MPAPRSPGALRLLACNGAMDRDVAAQEAVDRAWGLRFADAKGMLSWAELAAELATSDRMRALALAHLGNAHRVSGDFKEACRCLDLAEKLEGKPELLLLELRVTLYENQGLLEEAAQCLESTGRLKAKSYGRDREAKFLTLTARSLLSGCRCLPGSLGDRGVRRRRCTMCSSRLGQCARELRTARDGLAGPSGS